MRFSISAAINPPLKPDASATLAPAVVESTGVGPHLVERARRRITIGLVAMAVLPLLVVSLLPSVWTSTSRQQEESRLDTASQSVAATLSLELHTMRQALASLSADPSVAAVAAGSATNAQLVSARAALVQASGTLGPVVTQVVVTDREGAPRLSAAFGQPITNPAPLSSPSTAPAGAAGGQSACQAGTANQSAVAGQPDTVAGQAGPAGPAADQRGTASGAPGTQLATLSTPITSGKTTVGSVCAQVSLASLLATAPLSVGDGAYALVVDPHTGQVLADTRRLDVAAAGDTASGRTGSATAAGATGSASGSATDGQSANAATTSTGQGNAVAAAVPSLPILPQVVEVAGATLDRSRAAWERFLGGGWDVGLALVGSGGVVTSGSATRAAGAAASTVGAATTAGSATRAAGTPDSGAAATSRSMAGAAATSGSAMAASAAGTPAWVIVTVGPSPALPLAPVLVGLLLLALLVGLGVWLARRALRPAEELEASRAQLVSLYETARVDALYDALTGLGNHRAFQEEVDRQVEASLRYGPSVALLLIDLDEFKSVNDSAGHAAGDELLAQMGRLLQSTMRRVDRTFRIGGDEFAVLMPHTDAEGAETVAHRLLASALTSGTAEQGRAFSFSAGISVAPALARSRDELAAQADAALYWCKRHGRTSIQVYDRDRIGDLVDEHQNPEMSAAVARVAARRLIRAVFQPIVELPTGQVVGVEGLVRPGEESGFSNAGSLFAAAHATGHTIELDRACLEVVVAAAASLPPDRMLSLNLSPRTLEAPEFNAVFLHNLLDRHGIAPGRVVIELTEREDVENVEQLRRSVEACRALGIRIAADDVGSGNAGLRLLSQLPFDIVKIDLSLVQDGVTQESATAVLRSLADLARRWGALVIAEGIETAEQLRLVRDLGLNGAQGYLLARPSDTPHLEPLDLDELASEEDWLHRMARIPTWAAPAAG